MSMVACMGVKDDHSVRGKWENKTIRVLCGKGGQVVLLMMVFSIETMSMAMSVAKVVGK